MKDFTPSTPNIFLNLNTFLIRLVKVKFMLYTCQANKKLTFARKYSEMLYREKMNLIRLRHPNFIILLSSFGLARLSTPTPI